MAATDHLNSLFGVIGITGCHPTCWRHGTTVIVPEPAKPDYSIPKAYQPVVLHNCLGKIIEKFRAKGLTHRAEKSNLLYKDQIGRRQQHSAIDAAMVFTHETEQGKQAKKITTALIIDVSGVFDNISKDHLLYTL
jgi:hypothetical protein